MLRLLTVAFALAVVIGTAAFADTVYMKDGRKLEGTVVKTDEKHLHLKMKYGTQKLPLTEIEKVEVGNEKIPALIRQLGDPSWRTREKAARELVEIGEEAGPYLERALESKDAEVRWRAEGIMGKIGYIPAALKEKIEGLIEQAKDPNPAVSTKATDELKKIGRKALPEVEKALGAADEVKLIERLRKLWDLLNVVSEEKVLEARVTFTRGQRMSSNWKAEVARLRQSGMTEKDAARKVLDDIINLFEGAVAVWPGFIDARTALAVSYYRMKEYRLSAEHLGVLVNRDPSDVSLIGMLVNCRVNLRKYAEAEESLNRMLRIDPDSGLIYAHLGTICIKRKKYVKAIEHFEKAVSLGCRNASVLYNLAFAYEKKKKTEQAIRLYREALQEKPEDYNTLLRLGVLFYNLKRYDECVEVLEAFLKHHPRSGEAKKVRQLISQAKKGKQ